MLGHLKRIQGILNGMSLGMGELKVRVSCIESGQALIRQELSHQSVQIATSNAPMDRFDDRLSRIERRLDLIEA
jgi:hypothetical protein